MKKRGMELTISTLIVIILGLFVLTMGIIFIKSSFCKAIEGVTSIADLSEQEINNLFSQQEDSLVVVKEKINEIDKLTYYGVGFVIKNEQKVTSSPFKYSVDVSDLQDCDITETEARDYIITSKSNNVNIGEGDTYSDIIEFKIPKDAPTCSLKYTINVESNNQFYGSTSFTVRIKEASFLRKTMC